MDRHSDRAPVLVVLENEARRVLEERRKAKDRQLDTLPYEVRYQGCEAFLNLTSQQRDEMLRRVIIRSSVFNVDEIQKEVESRLEKIVIRKLRPLIARKLLEWWERRVTEGHSQPISRHELLTNIQNLASQYMDNNLPDSFGILDEEIIGLDVLQKELGGLMEKQIDLVDGKNHRKIRASRVRWQARNQRNEWMDNKLSAAKELDDFDKKLVTQWKDRFMPMSDDLEHENDEKILIKNGRELLDWFHNEAFNYIPPIRTKWTQPYLVQGSYQQLAEELRVGWHRDFVERLKDEKTK